MTKEPSPTEAMRSAIIQGTPDGAGTAALSPALPLDVVGWLVFAWSIGGVVVLLIQALVRLTPIAWTLLDEPLTIGHQAAAVLWAAFMLYFESWRGFHLRFSPRAVVRALRVATDRRPWLVLLAPLVAMGLVYATRRRLIANHLLVAGIIALVLGIRMLPSPWRAIIDLGVVLGLAGGTLSILYFVGLTLLGRPPRVQAEFPD